MLQWVGFLRVGRFSAPHPTLPTAQAKARALGNPPPRNLIKVVFGTSWGFFWGSKTFFLGLHFLMVFRIHFWWVFGANLGPTWLPKSTKIDEKSRPRCLRMLTCFFDRFLIDFCSQLRPPDPSKSYFSLWKNDFFLAKRALIDAGL